MYKKVFISCRSVNANTQYFVSLLGRRPEIINWIHKFVIDEYDVEYFPQLLAITFHNLENLILHHDGPVAPCTLSRRKLSSLNAAIKPQPALQDLKFSIEQKLGAPIFEYELYSLPKFSSPIFRHPRLVRVSLSYLDLTAFAPLPLDYFCHSRVVELALERCEYSAKNLQQLVHPCKCLSKLWLHHDQRLPFPENELPAVLYSVKDTLRVLKLVWGHLKSLTEEGMDFRAFPNLHAITVHPDFLFGKPYKNIPLHSLSSLITSKLPPNLLILALEDVVPLIVPGDTLPSGLNIEHFHYRRYIDPRLRDRPRDTDLPFLGCDIKLMRHILQEKEVVAPKLEWLVCFYLEYMVTMPKDVIALAEKQKVKCCGLYEYDEINPPIDMALHVKENDWALHVEENDREGFSPGEDSRGYCTHVDHSR